jgi:hypothetical protein
MKAPDIINQKYNADVNIKSYTQEGYLKVNYEIINVGDNDINYYYLSFEAQCSNGIYGNFIQGFNLLTGDSKTNYMYINNNSNLCTNVVLRKQSLSIFDL